MEMRILGPLEVRDGHGRALELGGRQQRILLTALLLRRNEVVSVDRLIDAIWGERPPPGAIKNVQVQVSRLRKALGDAEAVRTHANGYSLELAPGQLDLDRFEERLEDGRRALAGGDPDEAHSILSDALKLWRGPPLSDFAYDAFVQAEIARLEELRLSAVEERLEAELALGLHREVTSELQRLVAEHPLRERLRAQLILALYRGGRKPEALRIYEEARRLLAEELGLEPSESLRRLQAAVLADDHALAAPERARSRRDPPRVAGGRGRSAPVLGGGLLVLTAALAFAVLGVTRDTPAADVSVGPNSLAEIDPKTNRVVATIPVGTRPSSIVAGDGALWVANLDDETVSRVDPVARRVDRHIPTGTAPTGLGFGHDSVWAIGGDGVVLRIDPAFNEVVDRVRTVDIGSVLGGIRMAGAVAVTTDAVWAISGGNLSTPRLFRIDPAAARATPRVVTGMVPTALAVGFGDVWVTDAFESTVSRIDATDVVTALPVGRGASAVAVGAGAVWVANSFDDTVVRLDPRTGAVETTISVGRYPSAVAVGGGAVWVTNRDDGTVSRIDPGRNEVVETVPVGASPAGIVFAGGSVWVTNQIQASPPPVRSGGILRISVPGGVPTDPAVYADGQLSYATCARLLTHADAPAPGGIRIVPEVAAALPPRSPDGRTYTFTIRKGFAFSPPLREPVTAATFKRSIERSLHPTMAGSAYVRDISGQAAYLAGKATHITGIVASGNKLSITLVKPSGDFLARIAMPFFCAVPLNTPIDQRGVRAIPSAGPYYIAQEDPEQRIVLKRNPNYHGARPRRLREIHYTIGVDVSRGLADVEDGKSDYIFEIPPERAVDAELSARYGATSPAAEDGKQRYFVNSVLALGYLALNTSRPLFADVRWRKAVNYAIDRRALARLGHTRLSGDFPAIRTDQYLPPAMPGAARTPLYPPAGDIRAARRLAPEGRQTAVLYTCNLPHCRRQAQVIKVNLGAVGLDVDVREFPFFELFERAGTRGAPFDILAANWFADWADPSSFLNVLLHQDIAPQRNLNTAYYTDLRLAAKLERAARLSGPARFDAYRALSIELARDDAPWVVYAAGTFRDFFSARIGCQIFHPVYGIDLGALCVRG